MSIFKKYTSVFNIIGCIKYKNSEDGARFRFEFTMAMAGDITIKPDHVIIWLDKNMCKSGNNESSKNVLDNNANLHRSEEDEWAVEIDKLICKIDPELNEVRFETLITSPLRMFTEKNECIKCIHDSLEAKKQPFLITSGQMGALIVPEIHQKLSGKIYVFCAQRKVHEEWTRLYDKHIEIYDDEKGVFAKLLSDIAIYYYSKSQDNPPNAKAVTQYLKWAQQLFKRASKIDGFDRKDYLQYIREGLLEQRASQTNANDADDPMGEDPEENQ